MLVLKRVESSPLALPFSSRDDHDLQKTGICKDRWTHVDSHALTVWQSDRAHLGDSLGRLHVRRITASTKDDGDLGVGIDVVGRDEGTSGVVDQRDKLGGDILAGQLCVLNCPQI
jgi:hypothetical protein